MKRFLKFILCLGLCGCVTVPSGELQLGPNIARDMRESKFKGPEINKGRPIYVEARSYPQMLDDGDIWGGGTVMLYLGREDLSLDSILSDQPAHNADERTK